MNSAGFQDGSRLTLAQNGTAVTATYVDQNGLAQSLSFSTATDTVATITRKGQEVPGFKGLCILGPGAAARYPAIMSVNAGVLTYDAGSVFLNLTGALRSDAGECGALSDSKASFWLACEGRQDEASSSSVNRPVPAAELPQGKYSCSTQLETFSRSDGRNQYAAGGATGTLALVEDGGKVTARYSGDPSLAGTLRFRATTSVTAIGEAGQSLMAPCIAAQGTRSSQKAEPVAIAAGSLTLLDSTLFLSFAGIMAESSSCPGARVAGALICSR